jgi:hypothetical protein
LPLFGARDQTQLFLDVLAAAVTKQVLANALAALAFWQVLELVETHYEEAKCFENIRIIFNSNPSIKSFLILHFFSIAKLKTLKMTCIARPG